jgi:hypothetical protein
MKTLRTAVIAFAAAACCLVTAAPDALACGSAIRLDPTPQRPTPVMEIARAEKALDGGSPVAASQAVLATFPRIRNATVGHNPLETRAIRVFALSLVRSEGTADEKRAHVPTVGEWTPKSNVAWAVQALREIDQSRPNDPAVQADLGEALAKTSTGQAEALRILQGLAQKDLMGSPHAYAALAKLRSEKGDLAGAEAALKRCTEMSKSPGICKPIAPSKPVAAKA